MVIMKQSLCDLVITGVMGGQCEIFVAEQGHVSRGRIGIVRGSCICVGMGRGEYKKHFFPSQYLNLIILILYYFIAPHRCV